MWSELTQEYKPIHIVVGTQILLELEKLTKILELIDIDLEPIYKVEIPWIVTEELNELKNNGSSAQKAAVQNIFDEFQHRINSPRLILQNPEQDQTAARLIAIRTNHDKIIAHCMQLKRNGHVVKLFTVDAALQVRAHVMGGISNFDCDEALEPPEPMLMDLAGEIAQEIPPREAQLRQSKFSKTLFLNSKKGYFWIRVLAQA